MVTWLPWQWQDPYQRQQYQPRRDRVEPSQYIWKQNIPQRQLWKITRYDFQRNRKIMIMGGAYYIEEKKLWRSKRPQEIDFAEYVWPFSLSSCFVTSSPQPCSSAQAWWWCRRTWAGSRQPSSTRPRRSPQSWAGLLLVKFPSRWSLSLSFALCVDPQHHSNRETSTAMY